MRRNITVHPPDDRPDVEILIDGTWCTGEVRMQWQDDNGTWWAQVSWRPPGTNTRRLDNLPADRLRHAEPRGAEPGAAADPTPLPPTTRPPEPKTP